MHSPTSACACWRILVASKSIGNHRAAWQNVNRSNAAFLLFDALDDDVNVQGLYAASLTFDPASVATITCAEQDFTVPGAVTVHKNEKMTESDLWRQ